MSFFKRLIPLKAKASISLDKPSFMEGEPVVGKINVESNEYVQSTGVRIEARAYEHYEELTWVTENNERVPKMMQKQNTLFSRDVNISGPSDFGQGPTRSFPFSVGIPPFKTTHNGGSIEYSLKGVVAVKGRPDITGSTQIAFIPPAGVTVIVPPLQQVGYGTAPPYAPAGYAPSGYVPGQARAPAAPYAQPGAAYVQYNQAPPQPKLQVRCQYCQSMIDQGTPFCPNCGARQ
jgi:hypothetical protein